MEHMSSNLSLFEVNRPIYNEHEFDETYHRKKIKSDNVFKTGAHYCLKYYKPSGNCMKNYFKDRFPFLKWLLRYNLKENLLPDIISGVTIGIVHIPQGLAYGLLASLPAVTGLYVSFFSVIMYVLLGTSNHLSMGTFAITSLMTSSALSKFEGKYFPAVKSNVIMPIITFNDTVTHEMITSTDAIPTTSFSTTNQYLSNDPAEAKILISMCITFFAGVFHLIFALLHVGCVTKYISEIIVAGFTTGAAVHIVTSQIGSLLGFPVPSTNIPFKLVGTYIEIFKAIHKTTLPTVIVALVSIVILWIVREQINDRFKSKMIMPVPIELIIVIFGTLFSYLFKFNGKWNIRIVGAVPRGIPPPRLPPFELISDVFGDAMSIAIVSFAINISMAKLFAKKYKYEISPNQELIAYGLGNILSSFFNGFPACVALSRCAILESTGAKTQAYSFISSILVLIVCLAIGPLFETLPNACLASIIVVALKNMLLQIRQLPNVYRTSKLEAAAWLITFLGVITFDVDIGLYIGIGVSLLLIIIKTQRARASVLGNIPNTEIYEAIEAFEQALEYDTIKIIRYEESLYYANVENFKYQIFKLSEVNPNEISSTIKKHGNKVLSTISLKHIVIDCSPFNFIDSMGANAILQIYEIYQQIGIHVYLACCKPVVMKMFKKLSFDKKLNYDNIFPTIHGIISKIIKENAELSEKYTKHKLSNNQIQTMDFEITESYAF